MPVCLITVSRFQSIQKHVVPCPFHQGFVHVKNGVHLSKMEYKAFLCPRVVGCEYSPDISCLTQDKCLSIRNSSLESMRMHSVVPTQSGFAYIACMPTRHVLSHRFLSGRQELKRNRVPACDVLKDVQVLCMAHMDGNLLHSAASSQQED